VGSAIRVWSFFVRTLQFGVAMCNLGPRLPQTEAQGLEQSLALPNTEVDAKLPAQIGTQCFPVPKVGCQPGLLGWFPQNLPNDVQVLISQAARSSRATPLLKTSQPGTFKVPNPVLQCARGVPKDVGSLPAGHALRHQQDGM
jgi:hypothetical protein